MHETKEARLGVEGHVAVAKLAELVLSWIRPLNHGCRFG
jgi:hypothetical protein